LCLIHPSNVHEEVEDSEEDLQWEDLEGKVRYKTLRVSKSLRIRDNARPEVEEEVQELTQRLQALEADKHFMKQTIESLRRENGEMKLLQELAQQFRELGSVEQQEPWPKKTPMTAQFQVHLQMHCRLCNIVEKPVR
jgi:regulator of replication initiation timing